MKYFFGILMMVVSVQSFACDLEALEQNAKSAVKRFAQHEKAISYSTPSGLWAEPGSTTTFPFSVTFAKRTPYTGNGLTLVGFIKVDFATCRLGNVAFGVTETNP